MHSPAHSARPAVVVRLAGPDDLDTVVRKRLAFMAESRGVDPATFTGEFLAATDRFVRHNHERGVLHTWLATSTGGDGDGEVVALVSLLLVTTPPRPADLRAHDGYIINLYVEPAHRRRGVGRVLMDDLLASADRFDVRRFYLAFTDDGRALYDQLGFRPMERWLELRLDR